jgi:hypothetical protein
MGHVPNRETEGDVRIAFDSAYSTAKSCTNNSAFSAIYSKHDFKWTSFSGESGLRPTLRTE